MLLGLPASSLPPALVSTRRVFNYLASIYLPIAIGVFALFAVLIIFFTVRGCFRTTPGGPTDNNVLEGSYAVLLACVAAFLLYLTLTAEHKVDTVANQEKPSLVVDVTAAKWVWEFHYPADNITGRSGYKVGLQPLVVPEDRAIRFNLSSQDVIHAIWIPQLEFKRQIIPGGAEHVTLTFTRTGLFQGQCAVFCGLHHPEMIFGVRVLAPAAFQRWATQHRGGAT
ncbi:MAG TPA: cytochrome c oxidase subunit II [Solirubrobacteraceae bacterium]|nr:cytochrome c oxidase subunit II [Solirubrobacteraceae bacterium]